MFDNVQKSFSGMFGKIEPGKCRLTMNGVLPLSAAMVTTKHTMLKRVHSPM